MRQIKTNQIITEELLEGIEKPADYQGPPMEIILKPTNADNVQQIIDDMLSKNVTTGKKIGMFMKGEQEDGDLTKTLIERTKALGFTIHEMQEFMNQVNKVKIAPEITNIKIAANFTDWSFKKVIKEVEDCIEGDIQIKHKKIAGNIERMLDNPDKLGPWMQKNGVKDSQLLEYTLPVLVQSGDNITCNKFNSECDDNKIGSEVVYINVCSKYTDMQAMASRTLLFNPTKAQKEAYLLAFDAQQHLVSKLKAGTSLDTVYGSTLEFIKSRNATLAGKVHVNFGFGIGSKYKEEELTISAANSKTKVEPGMVFHVRITFKDVEQPKSKGPVAIGDTVLVTEDGAEFLTSGIPRKYQQISYTLDDDEDKEESSEEEDRPTNGHKSTRGATEEMAVLPTRTRGENKPTKNKQFEEELKHGQEKLLDKKLTELQDRYEKGDIQMHSKKQK